MGRPSNRAQRRAQIVDGLLSIICREGYDGASVAEIARSAGLASGLVHYHFPHKEAILVALVEHLTTVLEGRFAQRLAQATDDPLQRLDAFIDAHLAIDEQADPRAVAAWVAIGAEAVRRPEVQTLYESFCRQRLRVLEEIVGACGKGTLDDSEVPAVAATLMAAIEGAFLMSTAAPGAIPSGSAAPTLRRAARALVGGGS